MRSASQSTLIFITSIVIYRPGNFACSCVSAICRRICRCCRRATDSASSLARRHSTGCRNPGTRRDTFCLMISSSEVRKSRDCWIWSLSAHEDAQPLALPLQGTVSNVPRREATSLTNDSFSAAIIDGLSINDFASAGTIRRRFPRQPNAQMLSSSTAPSTFCLANNDSPLSTTSHRQVSDQRDAKITRTAFNDLC